MNITDTLIEEANPQLTDAQVTEHAQSCIEAKRKVFVPGLATYEFSKPLSYLGAGIGLYLNTDRTLSLEPMTWDYKAMKMVK